MHTEAITCAEHPIRYSYDQPIDLNTISHIMPEGDTSEHTHVNCPCNPCVVGANPIALHHRFDGIPLFAFALAHLNN